MEARRASKVAKVHAESPSEDAGILKQVLSYAGAGEWIFNALISKLWLECYRAVPMHQLNVKDTVEQEHVFEVVPQSTLKCAVFASAARVRLAHVLGLRFGNDGAHLQAYLGSVACKAALIEAHRLGMPFSTSLLSGAAYSGELSIVIWLYREHNVALTDDASTGSAEGGRIEVLQWLKQQGMVFDADTMSCAAVYGQISTCAYLHSVGCSWNDFTVFEAAFANQWDTVRWLHEHGCPWNFKHMCLKAAEQGEVSAMTYLTQQEPVAAYVLLAMLLVAGAHGHLEAAKWLRQRGAEWPRVLHFDGESWSGDVLEWARAEGCDSPLDQPLCDDVDDIDDIDEL
jgi:hypothetical protein